MSISSQLEASDLFYAAASYADNLLQTQLPGEFTFHSLDHTHDVIIACNLLAINEKVPAEVQDNLLLATCFHDTGYINDIDDHESASIEIASFILKSLNANTTKIREVNNLIEITRLNRRPTTLAECIIHDACTFYMCKTNYQECLNRLRMELEWVYGNVYTDKEWLLMNLSFLHEHQYYTRYAQVHWSAMKLNNLGFIEKVSNAIVPL